jgi:hypothetical protein
MERPKRLELLLRDRSTWIVSEVSEVRCRLLALRDILRRRTTPVAFGAKRTRNPDSWLASASAFLMSRAPGRLAKGRGGARLETFLMTAR